MTSPLLGEFLGTMVLICLGWSCRCGVAEALQSRRRRMDGDHCRVGVSVMAECSRHRLRSKRCASQSGVTIGFCDSRL